MSFFRWTDSCTAYVHKYSLDIPWPLGFVKILGTVQGTKMANENKLKEMFLRHVPALISVFILETVRKPMKQN